ncbi:MAG: hypothetical protein DDT41_01338 [candidate division WS2 bacterium]|nr:hypothetical protein [Candidatus Psychracetigena formicireducens]
MSRDMNRRDFQQQGSGGEQYDLTPEDLKEILKGNSEKMIECAEKFAKANLKGKSTSSIRKIYTEVMGMHQYEEYKLNMLRAKLAYVSSRKRDIIKLTDLLSNLIKEVKNDVTFGYFKDFFQAILAYFYKYGKE